MSKKFRININLGTLLVIIGVIFLITSGALNLHLNKVDNYKTKLDEEIKLKNALIDSMNTYVNAYDEVVNEKLTLQTSVKNLKEIKENLTNSQKNLLNRILLVEEEKKIITAALIKANIVIDSLRHDGETIIDYDNKKITFTDKKDDLEYDIVVENVIQANDEMSTNLIFNKLFMPNETFVEFHWKDERKTNHPISFSVTNTNKYLKVYNIESYAIPELKKEKISPTTWEGVTLWVSNNRRVVIGLGFGFVVGYMINQ